MWRDNHYVFPLLFPLLPRCYTSAWRGSECRRPGGGAKVDVKAQSRSKLYNRAEESTWQSR